MSVSIAILLFTACDQVREPRHAEGKKHFHTTAPSRLFFKNMRSFYYQAEETPEKMDRYQLRKIQKDSDDLIFIPVILDNWLEDEAYIRVQPNFEYPSGDTLTIYWSAGRQEGTYTLSAAQNQDHYDFAKQLYESLLAGHQLWMLDEDRQKLLVFTDQADRANYITTLRDYYKLTETR